MLIYLSAFSVTKTVNTKKCVSLTDSLGTIYPGKLRELNFILRSQKLKRGEGLECLSTSIRSRRNFNLFTIWVLKSRLMRSRLFSTFERVDFFGPPKSTF